MLSRCVLVVFLLALVGGPVFGQRKLDSSSMYRRLVCVLPVVGRGTWDDPKRPMYAPVPSQMKPGDRTGIIAYHFELTDDGNSAIVEFVTVHQSALNTLRSTLSSSASRLFERGKSGQADIEASLRAVKKDFDLRAFSARVQ